MYKHLFMPILTKLMYVVLFIYLVILRTTKQLLNLEFASLCSYFLAYVWNSMVLYLYRNSKDTTIRITIQVKYYQIKIPLRYVSICYNSIVKS
jgi:hypothetical protein